MTKKSTKNLKKTEAYPVLVKGLRSFGHVGRLVFFLSFLALLGVLAGGLFHRWANGPLDLAASPLEFTLPPGTGVRAAVDILAAAGCRTEPVALLLLARYRRVETKIRAGTYQLHSGATPLTLLDKLARGDVVQAEAVLPEGWTFRQIRARLDVHPGLGHDSARLGDSDVLLRVGAAESHPEGLFFPDTYRIAKGSSDLKLLALAYKAMQKELSDAWAARDPSLTLATPYQMLILASIIEKETGIDADRPLVSAVFHNRLRKKMPLQTDPTVIYGIGPDFDGNLRKRDLLTDTSYNTYLRRGLPPTPIAMPGRASLLAAARPATSNALYFVARGDGSSEFSATLAAHNRAVRRFQLGQ